MIMTTPWASKELIIACMRLNFVQLVLKVVNKIIILLEHFGKNKNTASAKFTVLQLEIKTQKLENDDDELAVHLLFYSTQN